MASNFVRTAFSFARAVVIATSVLAATVIGGILVRGVRRDPDDPPVWFAERWLWLVVGVALLIAAARVARLWWARRTSDGNLTAASDSTSSRVA